jgi:hypothetical protein
MLVKEDELSAFDEVASNADIFIAYIKVVRAGAA